MTLVIPEGNKLQITEYLSPECDNTFYDLGLETSLMSCPRPWCKGRGIKPNGDCFVIRREEKKV